jgi:competence protein ComEC
MRRHLFSAIAFLTFASMAPYALARDVTPSERVKRNVLVRMDPTTDSAIVGRLAPGGEAELIGELSGWYQVRLADGRTGYVSKSWTIIVDEDGEPLVAGTSLKVHVIDVGTGLATFVEGKDFALIYDAGTQDDLAMGQSNRVIAYIKAVRPDLAKIDHLILSHPHKDHLQLLPDVFDSYAVSHVWDSGAVNKTLGYCRFLAKVAAEPGVKYHNAIASGGVHEVRFSNAKCGPLIQVPRAEQMSAAPVRLGEGVSMSILYRDASKHHDPNENTVVVRLDAAGRRILMAGDAEAGARDDPASVPEPDSIEAKLLGCCAAELRADVLIAGHHGSKTSSRAAFLDAVGAEVYIISSGPFSYSGVVLPDADVVEELERRGRLLRTDKDDEACANDDSKIGLDADESPGGCHNILVTIGSGSSLSAEYNEIAD